jgi:DNA transformation protein
MLGRRFGIVIIRRTILVMSVSSSYLTFVLEQLSGVRDLVTKRMFGGVGIYSGDVFFAILDNDTVFFKVDDELRAQYREAGMPPFAPMPGKPAMEGYYLVPPDVLEDAEAMAQWARQSIAVAARRPLRRKAAAGRKASRRRR